MTTTFVIDPDAHLDYGHDWTTWLGDTGDTITTSTWTITPTGPTLSNSTHDNTTTTIWVDSCTLGVTYTLTNHITTDDGREDDRSLTLCCEQR